MSRPASRAVLVKSRIIDLMICGVIKNPYIQPSAWSSANFHRRPFLAAGERIATDPYGYATSGLGIDNQVVEVDVFTVKRGARLFPNLSHGADVFADHGIAISVGKKGYSDGFIFSLVRNVRYADPKDESTARERVHRGELFSEDDRVAQGQRHDTHAELDLFGHAGKKRTNGDGFKLMRVERVISVPVRSHADRVLFMPVKRVVNMVHDPDRVVTEILGLSGRFDHSLGTAHRSRRRNSRAESDSSHRFFPP